MANKITSDIEIEIHNESVNDQFLITPNALLRGEGQWKSLRLTERAMLAALLTLPSTGWKTSRTRVEAMALGHGRDAVTSILNGLREARHLYTRRVNLGGGKFRWQWRVYMFPQPEGFDPFPRVAENGRKDVLPGRTINGLPGHGEGVYGRDQGKHGVSAGRTIDGFSVHGKSVDGRDQGKDHVFAGGTIDGFSGTENPSLKEKDLREKDLRSTPPTPNAVAAGTAPVLAATEGGSLEQIIKGEERVDVDAVIRVRPDWSREQVVSVLGEAVSQGMGWGLAVAAMRDLASGVYGRTVSPRRLLANGPWLVPGATFVPSPTPSVAEMCSEHRGQLRSTCAPCAGVAKARREEIEVSVDRPEPTSARLAALAEMRRISRMRGKTCSTTRHTHR